MPVRTVKPRALLICTRHVPVASFTEKTKKPGLFRAPGLFNLNPLAF